MPHKGSATATGRCHLRPGASPTERFSAWYVRAIEKLKELPEGDGAFAALMIAIPLYERCITAQLKLADKPTAAEDIRRAIREDLKLDEGQRKVFWDMFRVGFVHHGMPKTGKTQWLVSDQFVALPEFRTLGEGSCVCFDPWKFAERVLNTFMREPRLIVASESFPLANVFSLRSDSLSPPARQGGKTTGESS